MKRVYHPHNLCEEYEGGMWRTVSGDTAQALILASADLMRDSADFKHSMQRAIREWPNSSEHNLTCLSMNRIAWLGHAGCCIRVGSPEDMTRLGWHTLNQQEQDEANRVAAEVLLEWESLYANGRKNCQNQD